MSDSELPLKESHMEELTNSGENYGTFRRQSETYEVNNNALNITTSNGGSYHYSSDPTQDDNNNNNNEINIPINHDKNKSNVKRRVSIRTDRHTGNRYRKTKSIAAIDNLHPLQYEKEVYDSNNFFTADSRRESSVQYLKPKPDNIDNQVNNNKTTSTYGGIKITSRNNNNTNDKKNNEDLNNDEDTWLHKSNSWKDHVLQTAANVWHNKVLALFILAFSVTLVIFSVSEFTLYAWKLTDLIYYNNNINTGLKIFLSIITQYNALTCSFFYSIFHSVIRFIHFNLSRFLHCFLLTFF